MSFSLVLVCLHVERQSIAVATQFSTQITVDGSFQMADGVLLHCLLTCTFEVTLTTTPFLLVPHSVLYLLKVNFEDAKKVKISVLDKMNET